MAREKNYKKTLTACYLGFVTQSISANFAPLLFLTFQSTYGITLEKIAMIPMVFYLAQLLIDLAATRFADRIGYRTCVVGSQVLSAVGLVSMAVLPELVPVPFAGLLISVVLYAVGSGLIEVLVSPIVEACPFEHKDGMMSLLHSSYCWGAVGVVLGSTLFFALFGIEHWKVLTVLWALLPLYNTWNFLRCPMERLVEEGEGMSSGELLRLPLFWLIIVLMVCSGASEATMAQWASAFTESALGVSKAVGDLAGPGLFAVFMGISRMLYGKFSERLHLTRVMLLCGVLCAGCYLLAALSASPVLGLAGCALCGLAVGIMWPGSISISAQKCPRGGTAMFAFLALAGDLGATVSPALVGSFAELGGRSESGSAGGRGLPRGAGGRTADPEKDGQGSGQQREAAPGKNQSSMKRVDEEENTADSATLFPSKARNEIGLTKEGGTSLKIGAYQFQVTGNIADNMREIERAILRASQEKLRILVFPECCLTGYPPHDLISAACSDFEQVTLCCDALSELAKVHGMYLVVGTITRENGHIHNSAIVFTPTLERYVYQKRALWGWDRDNFLPGGQMGVFEMDGIKIGIRICFEVRFPEYFRELYREETGLNLVLFYDRSDEDDMERYDLIRAHIRTRAVENVCHTLSVNTAGPYQTAPTALYDRSGNPLAELERNRPGLLVYDLALPELSFGEYGRKEISDFLQR